MAAINSLDRDTIPGSRLRAIMPIISNPAFHPDAVAPVCKAAAGLAAWVRCDAVSPRRAPSQVCARARALTQVLATVQYAAATAADIRTQDLQSESLRELGSSFQDASQMRAAAAAAREGLLAAGAELTWARRALTNGLLACVVAGAGGSLRGNRRTQQRVRERAAAKDEVGLLFQRAWRVLSTTITHTFIPAG